MHRAIEQTSRDSNAQGGAVFELLKIAPEDAEVIAAIQEFLSRPLDGHTRIGVLIINALGNPHVKDARLIAVLTASLDEPDEGVAPAAIQALTRIGRPGLEQAEPVLRRLANSPSRPNEVTDQASKLFKRWMH